MVKREMREANLYLIRQKEKPADGALERREGVRRLGKSIQTKQDDIFGNAPSRIARL